MYESFLCPRGWNGLGEPVQRIVQQRAFRWKEAKWNRARTWKLRSRRVYFRKSCAVEFWREAAVAVVSSEYAMRAWLLGKIAR